MLQDQRSVIPAKAGIQAKYIDSTPKLGGARGGILHSELNHTPPNLPFLRGGAVRSQLKNSLFRAAFLIIGY